MSEGEGTPSQVPDEELQRWRGAQTLENLGELTALWLEGNGLSPWNGWQPPDPETRAIATCLARANHRGFITEFSQPAVLDKGWAQRAAVCGYCTRSIAERIASLSARADFIVIVMLAKEPTNFEVAITRTMGRTHTILPGTSPPADDEWLCSWLSPDLIVELSDSYFVSAVDPVWGRQDALWEALDRALTARDVPAGSLIDPDALARDGLL